MSLISMIWNIFWIAYCFIHFDILICVCEVEANEVTCPVIRRSDVTDSANFKCPLWGSQIHNSLMFVRFHSNFHQSAFLSSLSGVSFGYQITWKIQSNNFTIVPLVTLWTSAFTVHVSEAGVTGACTCAMGVSLVHEVSQFDI